MQARRREALQEQGRVCLYFSDEEAQALAAEIEWAHGELSDEFGIAPVFLKTAEALRKVSKPVA